MKRISIPVLIALIVMCQLWQGTHEATAAPVINVSPSSVPAGGTFQVTGSGFIWYGANSALSVCVNLALAVPCKTVLLAPDGTFSTSFVVPTATTAGTYQVSAFQSGNTPAYAYFAVVATPPTPSGPTLSVSPNPISPGGILKVSGSGWPANQQIRLCVDIPNSACQIVTSDNIGSFATQLNIASQIPTGTYTVSAQFGTNTPVVQQIQIRGNTQVSLSPSPVVPGQVEYVSGSGFAASEQIIVTFPVLYVTGGSAPVTAAGYTDASGNFTIALPIPADAVAGNYIVTVRGLRSGLQTTQLMNVAAQPSVTADPTVVAPGRTVTLTGLRWSSNWPVTIKAQVSLMGGGVETISVSPKTDGTGKFIVQLSIPANATPGALTFNATQTQGGQSYVVNVTVNVQTVHPSLLLSASLVLPGNSVQVFLSGFVPGQNSPIVVSGQFIVPGAVQPVYVTVLPDANGSATTFLTVPPQALSGTVIITATQPISGAVVSQTLQVGASAPTITPTRTPLPTATPSPIPTPTFLPPPPPPPSATATPTVAPTGVPPKRLLKFKYVSLWYARVLQGSFNHIEAQANQRAKVGILVTVSFPNGKRLAFASHTNPVGHWSKSFRIPVHALQGRLHTGLVQLRLVNGNERSGERSLAFDIVR